MQLQRPSNARFVAPSRRRARRLAVIALIALAAGCGDDDRTQAFDEISRLPTVEKLDEIELGHFVVPVPVVLDGDAEDLHLDNLLQLDFRLVAIVAPRHVSRVEQLRDRNAGKIRDEVIRVCRHTRRDDLLEAEWTTLKAHLLDATQPLLGGSLVRRMATPHKIIEPL